MVIFHSFLYVYQLNYHGKVGGVLCALHALPSAYAAQLLLWLGEEAGRFLQRKHKNDAWTIYISLHFYTWGAHINKYIYI